MQDFGSRIRAVLAGGHAGAAKLGQGVAHQRGDVGTDRLRKEFRGRRTGIKGDYVR